MATAGRFQPPMGGIVDPTYLEQLAILNQMQATQPVQVAQPFDFLGSGIVDGPTYGFAPQLAVPDRRNFAPVTPAVMPSMPSDGGGGGDTFDAGSAGSGRVGQGVNNTLASIGLNLMSLPSFTTPAMLGRAIADSQINARSNAYDNLEFDQGLLSTISSGGGGIQTAVDKQGNTFTFVSPATIQAYDQAAFGSPGSVSDGGGFEGGFGYGGVSASDTGNLGFGGGSLGGYASDGASDGGMFGGYSPDAAGQEGFDGSPAGGGDSGGGKIVCTAMNEAYGFGSFRNRIWLAYAAKHLTKEHEVGYHAMFLPLVEAAYRQQSWYSKPLRKALENIARHRSADLRSEMRGTKRDTLGRAYRLILEPLCYAVGKLKGY